MPKSLQRSSSPVRGGRKEALEAERQQRFPERVSSRGTSKSKDARGGAAGSGCSGEREQRGARE